MVFSDPPWSSGEEQKKAAQREVGGYTGPAFEVFPSRLGQRRYPRLGSSQGVLQECYPTRQAAVQQPLLPSYLSCVSPLYVPVLCNQTAPGHITVCRENSRVGLNLHLHGLKHKEDILQHAKKGFRKKKTQ